MLTWTENGEVFLARISGSWRDKLIVLRKLNRQTKKNLSNGNT